jgi:hypothetical protein
MWGGAGYMLTRALMMVFQGLREGGMLPFVRFSLVLLLLLLLLRDWMGGFWDLLVRLCWTALGTATL